MNGSMMIAGVSKMVQKNIICAINIATKSPHLLRCGCHCWYFHRQEVANCGFVDHKTNKG